MTKRRLFIFIMMLLFFTATFFILFFDLVDAEQPARVYNISMIVRGKTSDSWSSMRQGAEQAASEANVSLSFITLSRENALSEQISLIWRETEGGANAIILSAADYEKMADTAGKIAERIPVVCVESPVNIAKAAAYVSADDYNMGVLAGERIINEHGIDGLRVFIFQGNASSCENIMQRKLGVRETLKNAGVAEIIDLPTGDTVDGASWVSGLTGNDAVVALESYALETLAQYYNDHRLRSADIYGIGNSGKIASFLELGIIRASVVQNDFSCGYFAVTSAVAALENRRAENDVNVEYRIIDAETMYYTENQRLLFPFVR